ncbi:MAG: hypothetical protein RSC26_14460 [Terrisporobacter sp.]
MVLTFVCGSVLSLSQSFANSSDVQESKVTTGYSYTIGEGSSRTTSSVAKGADSTATNEVLSIKENKSRQSGTLKCWVIDSNGNTVTTPQLYINAGQKHMKYTKKPSGNVRLKIQNPIGGTKNSVSTTGKFHS